MAKPRIALLCAQQLLKKLIKFLCLTISAIIVVKTWHLAARELNAKNEHGACNYFKLLKKVFKKYLFGCS